MTTGDSPHLYDQAQPGPPGGYMGGWGDIFGASDGPGRMAQARLAGSYTTQKGVRYPSPFFDLATTYMPKNVKQLFHWCAYYYKTNPLINAVVTKMAEYPVTRVLVDEDDQSLKAKYEELIEHVLQIRKFQIEANLDYNCFGNSFISVSFPFDKYIICRNCGNTQKLSDMRPHYRWRNLKFELDCPRCGHNGKAKTHDYYVKDVHRISLVRWSPMNINVDFNHVTGRCSYYYKLPKPLKNDILLGKKPVLEQTPEVFIEAARKGKSAVMDPASIFHLKRPTIAEESQGWGTPMIMPVLKDVFYLQVLRKGQEAIAQEHIVPLRVIFPQAGDALSSPYSTTNLGTWRERVEHEIARWRLDPNYIPVLPLPIGHQLIGGQGRAMVLHQELRVWAEHIVAGMGVPQEFVFGGLQYCLDLDSYVQTSQGLLQLREMVPGKRGLSLPGEGRVSTHAGVRDVEAVHNTGMKKAAVIRTKLGLDAAPSHDHRYRVLNPDLSMSWKCVHELVPGDRVAVRPGANLWPEEEVCVAHVAAEAKRQWEDNRKRDTSARYPCVLPNYLTDELSRVLGYLVAEGTCTDPRRFSFGQEDHQVMEDFLDCVEACFGYRPTPTTSTGGTSVEISREPVVTFLRLLGLTGDSYEKIVPGVVRRAPRQQVSEFLRAYFEGDGSVEDVEEKQMVSCGSVSGTLLKEVQLLLLNMGVVSSRYDDQLQIRSEFVDIFEQLIGFVSDRKRTVLDARTPTASTHLAERVPYLKENLDAFRERHFDGRSSWTFEPVRGVKLLQATYTVAEAAQLLGVNPSTVHYHARKGRLTLLIQARLEDGRFRPRLIARDDLQRFMAEYGRGVHRSVPGRDAWGMTYSKLSGQDLSFIREKEPGLAQKIEELAELRYVWDEVQAADLLDVEALMGDLTVAVDSSYNADGLVCHNSGSNVSMRMLENQFIGNRSDHLILVRDFILGRIAKFMGWPKVKIAFEKFRMADDLQRQSLYFQANQAQKISDSTLLEEMGEDLAREEALKQKEVKKQIEAQKRMQLAQAEIMGQQQYIQMQWQAKAMNQGVPNQPPLPPAAPPQRTTGQLTTPEGAVAYAENSNQQPAEGIPQEMQSPISMNEAGQAGGDALYFAKRAAHHIEQQPPDRQGQLLNEMKMRNPMLHGLVVQILQSRKGSNQSMLSPTQRPLAEQRPSRSPTPPV